MATYACNAGFVLDLSVGAQNRTCMNENGGNTSGVFIDKSPSCVREYPSLLKPGQHHIAGSFLGLYISQMGHIKHFTNLNFTNDIGLIHRTCMQAHFKATV